MQRQFVDGRLLARGAAVPTAFRPTVAPHDPAAPRRGAAPRRVELNPQTAALLELLELDFRLADSAQGGPSGPRGAGPGGGPLQPWALGVAGAAAAGLDVANPEEIDLGADDDDVRSGGSGDGEGGEDDDGRLAASTAKKAGGGVGSSGGGGGDERNEEELDIGDT